MKIKTISRAREDYERDRRTDVDRVERNRNPELHPFEQAREYTRSLQATKLEKTYTQVAEMKLSPKAKLSTQAKP